MTPYCVVTTESMALDGASVRVKIEYYEMLKDKLDQKEKGWIELDAHVGEGKHLIKIEHIVDLFYCPVSYQVASAQESLLE